MQKYPLKLKLRHVGWCCRTLPKKAKVLVARDRKKITELHVEKEVVIFLGKICSAGRFLPQY